MWSSLFAHNSVQKAPTGPNIGLAYGESTPLRVFSGWDFFFSDHISCAHLVLPITLSRKPQQAPKLAWLVEKVPPYVPCLAVIFYISDHISCAHLVLHITLSKKPPQAPKLAWLIEKVPPRSFAGWDFLISDQISRGHLVLPITLSRKPPQPPKLA